MATKGDAAAKAETVIVAIDASPFAKQALACECSTLFDSVKIHVLL